MANFTMGTYPNFPVGSGRSLVFGNPAEKAASIAQGSGQTMGTATAPSLLVGLLGLGVALTLSGVVTYFAVKGGTKAARRR